MSTEPVCVRRTSTLEEASIIVAWLADNDVEAQIADPDSPGVMAFGITDPEGIEVYVKDQAAATKAKALLEEHDRKHHEGHDGPDIELTCEACGQQLHFSADYAGTTQECPECGAHVDVGSA